MIKAPLKRARVCQSCKGKGGENVKGCTDCKGKGIITKMSQMGPGMYQQTQQVCITCKGEGNVIE
jgi:DnaJ-class molecular chaperone